MEGLVAQAHLVGGAGPEVLDEDVRGVEQAQKDLDAVLAPQVQRDTPLVAVRRHVVDALAPGERSRLPRRVAGRERFDLDYVSTEVAEHHRGHGAGEVASEIDHANAVQRRHQRSPSPVAREGNWGGRRSRKASTPSARSGPG